LERPGPASDRPWWLATLALTFLIRLPNLAPEADEGASELNVCPAVSNEMRNVSFRRQSFTTIGKSAFTTL
jgi:hypothetical protein